MIPKAVREALGLGEGDALLVGVEGGRIVLIPPGEYARRTRGALRGLWGSAEEIAECLKKGTGRVERTLDQLLREHKVLGLDTSVRIYHFEDLPPYSRLTEALFTAAGDGAVELVIPSLCVAEFLVKPWARGE